MVHARPRVLAHVLITDAVHVRCGVKQGSDQLQAKLDSLLAEARKTQAETMSEVHWRGHGVPVRSEKVRARREYLPCSTPVSSLHACRAFARRAAAACHPGDAGQG